MSKRAAAAVPDGPRPKSMSRPKKWSEEVEEVYRFQLAGYRDKTEYDAVKGGNGVGALRMFNILFTVWNMAYISYNLRY